MTREPKGGAGDGAWSDASLPKPDELRRRLIWNSQAGRLSSVAHIAVVIPIHNAFNDLCLCLDSVLSNTDCTFRLLLINDGSTDPRVEVLLNELKEAAPGLDIIDHRGDNRGFVQTANEGMRASRTNDVVLLNSDTVVSPGWLTRLARAAASRPDVATVTPLTNNGTLCSIPVPFADNSLPAGYDVTSLADLVDATSSRLYPQVPTGVGFCMLVTRRAIDAVGPFDETAFGRGYGEENDFCQRALAAGLVNIIADDTFVFHRGQGSFGPASGEMIERQVAVVEARHPEYGAAVRDIIAAHPLESYHQYLARCLVISRSGAEMRLARRVLHVLHTGGGTEKHVRELAASDDRNFIHFVSTSDGSALTIDEYGGGEVMRCLRFPFSEAVRPADPRPHAPYRDALTAACAALRIHVLHVHHLRHNTIDVTRVAQSLRLRYLVTIHDYHVVCPQYTLLDPDGEPCGACLGQSGRSCEPCMRAHGEAATYLERYQAVMEELLHNAAEVLVPNITVRDLIARRYPDVPSVTVVEHGHRTADISEPTQRTVRQKDGVLCVALLGGLERHKGGDVLRDVLTRNTSRGIVFHLYGTTPDPAIGSLPLDTETVLDGSRFVYHGSYDSIRIVSRLLDDGIDVGLHLSVWPETFSYTLSEFAAAGIPVIADASGAQGERVRRGKLGWTLPNIRDAEATVRVLAKVEAQPELLDSARATMRRDLVLKPIEESWREYSQRYRRLMESRPDMPERHGERTGSINPDYVAELATVLARERAELSRTREELRALRATATGLEELLRSPRHRVATLAATVLQRIPVVWPVVARVTDALIARRRTGATTQPSKPAHRHE